MEIAQIGNGFVGSALHKSFKGKGCDTVIYDKFQGVGSIEEVLVSDILFMCLPTPYVDGFGFDLSALTENLKLLSLKNYEGLIVIKSTIEPGITERLSSQYENLLLCHNPEFLTARTAFEDFDNQEHVVIGTTKMSAERGFKLINKLYELYQKLYPSADISVCKSEESEAMKLFCNNFYAIKVQIFNEFYYLSQKLGIDFDNIKEMMFKNNWINPMHTAVPGTDGAPSYGGACVDPESILFEKEKGKIKAKEVAIGNHIFDGKKFTRVTRVGQRLVKNSIEINSRGRILKASEDHIHMVYNQDSNLLEEKLFRDIKTSDYVYIPRPKYGIKNYTNYKWASTNSSKYKDGWITKIRSIKVEEKLTEVISIETESHLYVANGMLTHNCFPKDTNALCHMMKTLGSPHDVLEACIGERNKMRELKLK